MPRKNIKKLAHPPAKLRQKDKRVLREATALMKEFSVDLSMYGAPELIYDSETDDGDILDIIWTHKFNKGAFPHPLVLRINRIFTDGAGNILQCGANYGDLAF